MRRALLTVLILAVPVVASIVVYFIVNPRRQPTRRDAIGIVVTLAGSGAPGVQDGPNRSAGFSDPFGVAIDSKGNVFVADGGQSNCIRVITTTGVVAKIAGSSENGFLVRDTGTTFRANNASKSGGFDLLDEAGGNVYQDNHFGTQQVP